MSPLTGKQQAARLATVALTSLTTALHWMASSLFGFLALVTLIYGLMRITGGHVLSLGQSVEWLLSLDPQILLGVAGTIAAYAIAVNTWRQQKSLDLQLAAISEITAFFTRFNDLSRQLSQYSDQLLDLHKQLGGPPAQLLPIAKHLLEHSHQATAVRAELSRMSIDVHNLRAKHELVITRGVMTSGAFVTASSALDRVSKAMWFSIPTRATDPAGFLHSAAFIDRKELATFGDTFDWSSERIAMSMGAMSGAALGRLLPPTFVSVFHLWKNLTGSMSKDP